MDKIIDYLYTKEKRLISPIWHGEKAFAFLCLGHIDFAKALGFSSYLVRDSLEKIQEDAVANEAHLDKIIETGFFDYSYFQKEIEALLENKKLSPNPFGGGCFGPLTVAANLLGAERTITLTRRHPEFLKKTVAFINGYMLELAQLEEKNGADFFWIAEPLASLLSPKMFWQFSGQYLQQIYRSLSIPGFLHVCGKTLKHTPYMIATGAQVLSIDYVTDIAKNIRMVPEEVIIMGNIDPVMLKYGTKEEITEAVLQVNEACQNFKNFILSSGCAIPEEAPEENVRLLFDITNQFPQRSNEEYRTIRKMITFFLTGQEEALTQYQKQKGIPQKLIEVTQEEAARIRQCQKEDNRV